MEWLHAHIGSAQATLQQTPVILKPVRMNPAFDVFHGVVDYLVLKLIKAIIGVESVSVKCGTGLYMLSDFGAD